LKGENHEGKHRRVIGRAPRGDAAIRYRIIRPEARRGSQANAQTGEKHQVHGGSTKVKHIVIVNEQLFRAIEAASIIRDAPMEHTVDALLREALAARESGETDRRRPTAVWPPAGVERRGHA
jgi:hypothetical protein